ncbi:MATE family efflux transporter [Glaciimonas sp. Gout2]|uniref:MATE family efflux transporter n=1 Tax=unclassified Glaciimonas TaxID=2644401 RepID=UPI002B23B171|nr:MULTISPECIES: MATE family efflux transporter [unclassified Glaciimonas]MEB0011004.1 MATE family efflux transporter [Glaciimonas sp. Cout2]MEB0083265.1 MATE family efflux transporter [Glaciimonas sp. Gout2]
MKPASSHSHAALIEGPIAKTLFFFTLPILFGNVLQSLNGSVNAVWVGHYLGESALTATANSNAILFFLITSVLGLGMAATILVGQSLGARNTDQAKRVVGTSITFFLCLSLLVAMCGFLFSRRLMEWMHTPHDALPLAVAYLRIIFLALPFQFSTIFITMILRGAGDTKTPLKFQMLSVGLDIALNPLFIFGWGLIPPLGIAGSAVATLVAQSISLTALVSFLYYKKHFLCLHAGEGHYLRPDRAILKAMILKGIPMGLQMVVISLSMIMMISLVNHFGTQTSAAYGACLQLWNYVQMPALAVGMAVSSMAAQNIGARRLDRVQRIAMVGIMFNFLMTGGLVTLIYLFNQTALSLFLPAHVDALPIAQHINAMVAWSFVALGVTFVLSSVMRASGAVVAPLVILFLALWCIRLPFASVLMESWGADALWWSFGVGSLSAMLMSMGYYRFGPWRNAHMLPVSPASAT